MYLYYIYAFCIFTKGKTLIDLINLVVEKTK